MNLIYKLNTGTIKTSKHTQTRFTDENKQEIEQLELNPELLLATFLKGYKHLFGGVSDLSMNDRINLNTLKRQGFNSVSFSKSTRGCFTTYIFETK